MQSRRDVLKTLAAGVAAGAAVAVTGNSAKANPVPRGPVTSETVDARPVWSLLGGMTAGTALGLGWSIGALSDVDRGAASLTLVHDNASEVRVDLCARGSQPVGLASNARLDLILVNHAQGRTDSDEPLGRVLVALAHRLEGVQPRTAQEQEVFDALLPHSERVALVG